MTEDRSATEDVRAPSAVSPEEWRQLREGARRVLVGRLHYFDREMIQLACDEGGAFNIAIAPKLMFQMDTMLNPRFEMGVRRAIMARATRAGWEASMLDVFEDVEGHGCPQNPWAPQVATGPQL